MRVLLARLRLVAECLAEWWRHGLPTLAGDPTRGMVFLVDGVGGLVLTPAAARRAFRQTGFPLASYIFDWHRGPRGEMLADLACLRSNRRAGLRLARLIRRFHREHPAAPVHVLAYSGGTGIAVFAAEHLRPQAGIDTLILACPALSPGYPLAAALANVRRCYAFISRRDYVMLGLCTSLFGTIDRRFEPAAGLRGFHPTPQRAASLPPAGYANLVQVPWTPAMRPDGHYGHHTGCAAVAFIRRRLVPLLTNASIP